MHSPCGGIDISHPVKPTSWQDTRRSVRFACAVEQAKANGFEQLELGVFEDNQAAIHLYEKFGFRTCGVQPRAFKLKDGSYRDELFMVKML